MKGTQCPFRDRICPGAIIFKPNTIIPLVDPEGKVIGCPLALNDKFCSFKSLAINQAKITDPEGSTIRLLAAILAELRTFNQGIDEEVDKDGTGPSK